ncbi:polysaccharide deacetylase [Kaistella flava (ex Peng et al. 2021)]|uniref:Polysaccharide deacetylase n=1 Tax=Kaistella flava (ex Peng et al. 2021) TaxID=2038776 RepID=A0A7M2Y5Z1_9FLAO|nr:polysaccharide deacetylase [Kaistella flava (ex Peng et al. 2021)]QOW09259.1 polysaccharide deacetylase [Kaistella flava (ex Peng et al. 2021)]
MNDIKAFIFFVFVIKKFKVTSISITICNVEGISPDDFADFFYTFTKAFFNEMILLTFNIINPDRAFKNVGSMSSDELLEITIQNTKAILRSLESNEMRATFFIEISLLAHLEKLIKKIINEGHEISFYNIDSTLEELEMVKKNTEDLIGKQISGIRMIENAFDLSELHNLRFTYVSLNEDTALIFPFKRFERKASFTEKNGLSILHESISRYAQIPFNDFIFQIIPLSYYESMVIETIKKDEFVLVYLNSWQF